MSTETNSRSAEAADSRDYSEIMRRIGTIGPALSERARDCDAARQVVPESIRLMIDAGLFRIPQPARTADTSCRDPRTRSR